MLHLCYRFIQISGHMIRIAFLYLLMCLLNMVIASNWVDSKHTDQWYNAFDLCMIKSSSNDSVDNLMKNCETSVASLKQPLLPIRCRAGNTWPSRSGFCSSSDIPFSQRNNLQRSVEGYDNPAETPLASFFRKLSAQNGAMLIVGDSVMQQFFSAIACELEREGVWKNPDKFTNTDEVQHVKFHDLASSATIKFLPIYHFVNGRFDRIANASMHHLTTAVETMISRHSTLVIVLNMGLHYVDNPVAGFSRVDYQAQMTMALSYLHNFVIKHSSKHIKVFFREMTAQHFSTPNGYWPGIKYSNTMQLGCFPLNDSSPAADWRNRDIEHIILKNNLFNVKILRFYNITVSLWSEHPNGHLKDCTHFCWSPMLYQPTFHELDDALSAPSRWSVVGMQ